MNFKTIAIAAIAFFAAASASAQYLCTTQGTVLTFSSTNVKESKTTDGVTTVSEVSTAADGVVTARYKTVEKVPGNDFAEITTYSTYTYNPADDKTVYTLMSGEDFKTFIVNMVVEGAEKEGQHIGDADKAELEKNISVKGDLTMELPATIVEGVKVPNRTIKVNVGPMTMSMSLWDVKYLGYENVDTPAGNYSDCLKVSFVMKNNSPAGSEKKYCTSWFAKGLGAVKTITTDKKGKVEEEEVLKSIKE